MAEHMELPPFKSKGTSFLKTCFNGLNALSGIGIIAIPYSLSQSGWLSLGLLVAMAIVTCFTGLLLQKCMDSNPSIKTYSDVGSCAFGHKGRIIISIFMYLEVYLVPTGFLILEGDNLHKLFPNVSVEIGGHNIGGRQFFTVLAGLVILPSMWLKDLSLLSFVSASGVLSSVVVIASILWVGVFDGVGFSGHGEVFNLGGVPTSLSLDAFCYGAHPVFPTLYTSIKDKSQFSKVMLFCFSFSTVGYVSMAIIGYAMFGNNVQSQITLNLPTNKLSSKIAIYTTLVGPVAKYALIITPLANAIESCLPSNCNKRPICILLRTLLLISTVFIALVFPFFGYMMALVGAILNVSVSIILPCICYLKIFEVYKRWGFELVFVGGIIVMAFLVGVLGTYSSVKGIVTHF